MSLQKPLGSHSMVALIPARAGSKRCPGKNTRLLGGKPLIQWSLEAAEACGLFSQIIVSSDDADTRYAAIIYGVTAHDRKPAHATDTAPDYLWVNDVMRERSEEIFCILRPTSPFRTASTIRRAYARLIGSGAHSVRAVEKVTQHPGKMWYSPEGSKFMEPALDGGGLSDLPDPYHDDGTPWHSSPTQTLPTYYVQNASLEMAWTWVLRQTHTISGHLVAPFLTESLEGFDINTEADFAEAERLAVQAQDPRLNGGRPVDPGITDRVGDKAGHLGS